MLTLPDSEQPGEPQYNLHCSLHVYGTDTQWPGDLWVFFANIVFHPGAPYGPFKLQSVCQGWYPYAPPLLFFR